jgi:oligopeptide/dipeptide ABC transporter ATP-binding protein
MALSCRPKLLIADEPTTALDVTIQAQILALIKRIRKEIGMAVLMITHDLGVIAETADDVVVAYAGKAVEYADVFTIFKSPAHPYTQALYNSIPRLTDTKKRRLEAVAGMVPNPLEFPPGCRFHPRCTYAKDFCRTDEPPLISISENHSARCFMHDPARKGSFQGSRASHAESGRS